VSEYILLVLRVKHFEKDLKMAKWYVTKSFIEDIEDCRFVDHGRGTISEKENSIGFHTVTAHKGECLIMGGGSTMWTQEGWVVEGSMKIKIIRPFPHKFRMYDDDDQCYYEGYCEEEEFDPLDDYGAPNAGCAYIKYYNKEKKEWEVL